MIGRSGYKWGWNCYYCDQVHRNHISKALPPSGSSCLAFCYDNWQCSGLKLSFVQDPSRLSFLNLELTIAASMMLDFCVRLRSPSRHGTISKSSSDPILSKRCSCDIMRSAACISLYICVMSELYATCCRFCRSQCRTLAFHQLKRPQRETAQAKQACAYFIFQASRAIPFLQLPTKFPTDCKPQKIELCRCINVVQTEPLLANAAVLVSEESWKGRTKPEDKKLFK